MTLDNNLNTFNISQEWDFIINEIHSRGFKKVSLIKKELLFVMQILLCRLAIKAYLNFKRVYCDKR